MTTLPLSQGLGNEARIRELDRGKIAAHFRQGHGLYSNSAKRPGRHETPAASLERSSIAPRNHAATT
jgi:hypothetical protein